MLGLPLVLRAGILVGVLVIAGIAVELGLGIVIVPPTIEDENSNPVACICKSLPKVLGCTKPLDGLTGDVG